MTANRRVEIGAALLSFALLPAASASAATSVYAGVAESSSQFSPVVIKTAGSRISQVIMRWETRCTSGYGFVFKGAYRYAGPMPRGSGMPGGAFVVGQSKLFADPISKKGKFRAEIFGSVDIGSTQVLATQTTKISGTLKKRAGSGTFTARTVIAPIFLGSAPPTDFTPDICDTGTWRWNVQRGPSVFGGVSQQDEPVVVLHDQSKSIAHFIFGWRADNCQEAGTWWDFPDRYGNFPVARNGSFGSAFTDEQPGPDGGKVVFAYNIAGHLKGQKANGTLGVSPQILDSSGNPVGGCSTSNVAWSAASG